jgi:polyhydroxyalkanoate synthesis repressor PhaR
MPIIIKRYRNRKLYNTQSKRYVTLEQIEELIKDQEEIRVIDNASGENITAATLGQIIFELEKNQSGFLPVNLLFSLVQSGGNRLDEIRRNVFNTLNLAHHYDVEIERRINQLMEHGELSQEMGSQMLEKLLSVSSRQEDAVDNLEDRITEFLKQRQIPTKNDLHALIDKIDDLSRRVEELNTGNIEQE